MITNKTEIEVLRSKIEILYNSNKSLDQEINILQQTIDEHCETKEINMFKINECNEKIKKLQET